MDQKIIVKKSVKLVTSYYNLSLIEHRFVNMCTGSVYYTKRIDQDSKCKVYTERYAKVYEISNKEAFSQLKEIQQSLKTKKITLVEEPLPYIEWIDEVNFISNDELYVKFKEEIIPYIFNLEKNFITYNLNLIKHMKSMHSIRLYEIFKTRAYDKAQWKLNLSVNELKLMLVVNDKYSQYGSFKRMLDSSILEINEHTDINVNVVERKLRKKVVGLAFLMKISS
ncbi:MAG: replication initiation protein [Nitrososphaeraceae archaeon]